MAANNPIMGNVAAAAPASDPSMPPADGANLLSRMPSEVLHSIVMGTDHVTRRSLRLTCKDIHSMNDNPPAMSLVEYINFQQQLEIHSSRKLRHLYCPSCDTFKRPVPSKTTFTDAQAVQNHSGRRICVECGTANGYYDRREVVIKKKKLFLCGGCKLLLPLDKEETVIVDSVFTRPYPWHSYAWGQGAEITIDSGRKRWCKTCRVVIANLGASGAVKVKQVYTPQP